MSSISGIGSGSSMMQGMQGMRGMKKPDPAEMADNLFSKLDTSGQGFIQKSDLQSAFAQISSSSQTSDTSSSVDELFSQLDTDSDGKVTKQEFSDTLQKLSEQLEQQFQSSRMQGAMQAGGMGGTPPPPPPGGGDQGMSKEQLSSAAAEVGSTDSGLASMLSNVAENFDAADTNSDGKVSLQETIAYEQSKNSSSSTSSTSSSSASSSSTSTSTTSAGADLEGNVMRQIMKLMQAYGPGNDGNAAASSLSLMA